MTTNVVSLRDKVVYVLSCPKCGGLEWEIYVTEFDLRDADMDYFKCLKCDSKVYLNAECKQGD